MQQHFEIHASPAWLGLTLAGHVLLALAIIAYVEPMAMMLGGLLAVGLLAGREYRSLSRQRTISLTVNPHNATIGLQQGGQTYFFGKYKVYATRWFAILKLIDEHNYRALILIPDRFDSIQSYRRLRFALQTMDRSDAA